MATGRLPGRVVRLAMALTFLFSLSYTLHANLRLATTTNAKVGGAEHSLTPSSLLMSTFTKLVGAATGITTAAGTTTLTAGGTGSASPQWAVAPKLGVAPPDGAFCQHGGLELETGDCICGKGTQGARCETVAETVMDKVHEYGVCGPSKCAPPAPFWSSALVYPRFFMSPSTHSPTHPHPPFPSFAHSPTHIPCMTFPPPTHSHPAWHSHNVACWASYVWYPTEHFQFQPLPPKDDENYEAYTGKLLDFLVWQEGGELRLADGARAPSSGSPPDVWTALGPWSRADKQMLAAYHAFHQHRHARGPAPSRRPRHKPQKPTIVFGLMLHDDVPKFKALWQALFHEEHYFLVHIDARLEEDDAEEQARQRRRAFLDVIAATPLSAATASVWDRVHVLDAKDCVDSLWGDITLVYSEVLLWLRLGHQVAHWQYDYFINLSGSDIPVLGLDGMASFFLPFLEPATQTRTSFVYHHDNTEEFRQQHIVPQKEAHERVVVFNLRQNETNFGRYRARVGITRLRGCSQWHALHRTLLERLVTTPEVEGLLFSLRYTSIPDEAFFGTAAVWLSQRFPEDVVLESRDLRYWNEGYNRNLAAKGELRAIIELRDIGHILFARKSYTAMVTCAYTNKLLGLQHNCSVFADTGPFPSDAVPAHPPRRPADATEDE